MGRGRKPQGKKGKQTQGNLSNGGNKGDKSSEDGTISSTQVAHGILSSASGGDGKIVPSFGRKRSMPFAKDLELSLPMTKILPSHLKREKRQTSPLVEEGSCESPTRESGSQPATCNEQQQSDTTAGTIDESRQLCGEGSVLDDTNTPTTESNSAATKDSECLGKELGCKPWVLPSCSSAQETVDAKDEAGSSTHALSLAPPSDQTSPRKDPNVSSPTAEESQGNFLSKLSEFCDLVDDESDSDGASDFEFGGLGLFGTQGPRIGHQGLGGTFGFPASQPLPQGKVFRAPGLILSQATATDGGRLAQNSNVNTLSCETEKDGLDDSLEELPRINAKQMQFPVPSNGDDVASSGMNQPTKASSNSSTNASSKSPITSYSIGAAHEALLPCNDQANVSTSTSISPIQSNSIVNDDMDSDIDDLNIKIEPDKSPESSKSPDSHAVENTSPLSTDQPMSIYPLAPETEPDGANNSVLEHNRSLSLYEEKEGGVIGKKIAETHLSQSISPDDVRGLDDLLSESIEDTSVPIAIESAPGEDPLLQMDYRRAFVTEPPVEHTVGGTSATLPSSALTASTVAEGAWQDDTLGPSFDESGVKLLQGILGELSTLNRFVMTCKREVETARRQRMAWLRSRKQSSRRV